MVLYRIWCSEFDFSHLPYIFHRRTWMFQQIYSYFAFFAKSQILNWSILLESANYAKLAYNKANYVNLESVVSNFWQLAFWRKYFCSVPNMLSLKLSKPTLIMSPENCTFEQPIIRSRKLMAQTSIFSITKNHF